LALEATDIKPGIFFLSCWYTRKELPSRIATFYSGYTLSSAFGGLIAAGIVEGMEGLGGYPSSVSFLQYFEPLVTIN
jgi:hypothetical protein